MRQKTQQEDLMIRYLLGDLSEAEQAQIEERFLADDQYFEQLCAVEDALIDDYAQGALAEQERVKVEGLLLSSRRQAREVKLVQDMITYLSEGALDEPGKPGAPFQPVRGKLWLLAILQTERHQRHLSFAVIAILLIGAGGLFTWNLALQKQVKQMEAAQAGLEEKQEELRRQLTQQEDRREAIVKELESERGKRAQLEDEVLVLQAAKPMNTGGEVALLDLSAASFTRGGGELRVMRLSGAVSRLRIRIKLDARGDYQTYRVVIKTFDGQVIWSANQIIAKPPRPAVLVFTLPAAKLGNNDYILTLEGRTEASDTVEIGDYPFRITK